MINLSLRPVTRDQAGEILTKFHYLGSKGFRSSRCYGLFERDELSGVCVFHGISVPETCVGAFGLARTDQRGLFELGRLAVKPAFNGGNRTSWFVSRAIKQLRRDEYVRAIISYADSSAGHLGSIYRACNGFYCGTSRPKSDFWVNGKIQERGRTRGVDGEWKPRPIKHRYVWVFDPTLILKWNVEHCNRFGIPKQVLGQISIRVGG